MISQMILKNDSEECFYWAFKYYKGDGVKQDYIQAKKFYGKVCDLGSNVGCDNYRLLNLK